MTAFVKSWSIVDQGEVRRDQNGVWTTYLRAIALMGGSNLNEALNANETALYNGLPQFKWGQPHPNQALYGTETNLYAQQFQGVQKKHTAWWDVMVTYSSDVVANPLLMPSVIGEVRTLTLPGATHVDGEGNPILNTAGEPMEPIDKPEKIVQLPIISNIAATPMPTWLLAFEDCTNSDAVTLPDGTSAAAKTVVINSITVSAVQTAGTFSYRVCTIELLYRQSGWTLHIPSRGFNQLLESTNISIDPGSGVPLVSITTQLRPIKIKGETPSEPQFLDSSGKWIQDPSPGDVVLIDALIQPAISFSDFPLNLNP